MKTKTLLCFFLVAGIIFLFQNCAIQKRKYQKGFYVSSKKHKAHSKGFNTPTINLEPESATVQSTEIAHNISASALKDPILEHSKKNKLSFFKVKDSIPLSCKDTIILVNSTKILARDINYSGEIITYKKCDYYNTEINEMSKTGVASIHLADGTRKEFNPIIPNIVDPSLIEFEKETKALRKGLKVIGFLISLFGLLVIVGGCLFIALSATVTAEIIYGAFVILGCGVLIIIAGLFLIFNKDE